MSKRSMAPLTQPQAKRNPPVFHSPLPVPLSSLTGVPSSNNYWTLYHGVLTMHDRLGPEGRRCTVMIGRNSEARALYENGYFGLLGAASEWIDQGRVLLENWTPGCDMKAAADPCWNMVLKDEDVSENDNEVVQDIEEKKDKLSVNSQPPSNWGDLKDLSCSEEDMNTNDGNGSLVLHLELCEAFFLSYALGCLTVSNSSSCNHSKIACSECQFSLLAMWQLFLKLEPDFPIRYRAYHHYRAKGWIVRSGYCMGADWALYKLGPPHYHASYTVRVEAVDKKNGQIVQTAGLKQLTWGDMLAQSRVAVTVKKELLVVRIEIYSDFKDWETPHCLGSMNVSAFRIKRWVAGDQRWVIKPKVPVQEKNENNSTDAVIILD